MKPLAVSCGPCHATNARVRSEHSTHTSDGALLHQRADSGRDEKSGIAAACRPFPLQSFNGSVKTNSEPLPIVLSTAIVPPWASTNVLQMDKPSPFPGLLRFASAEATR